MEKENIC